MKVILQVSLEVAALLHRRDPPYAHSATLFKTIETYGLKLEAMHQTSDDPSLQSYFTVEVPDSAVAERLIEDIRQSKAVLAAYVKPPDELP